MSQACRSVVAGLSQQLTPRNTNDINNLRALSHCRILSDFYFIYGATAGDLRSFTAAMTFDSQLEADASKLLAEHGIVRAAGVLPVTFYDANGAPFKARADFIHAPTGVLFELKHSSVNGAGTQARAATKRRKAWSDERNTRVECDWNHSAEKLALVQEGIARAGGALVALFWREPDPATVARLNRRGTFWTVYGSPSWRSLVGFLKLRAAGIRASLSYADGAHVFA